MADEEKKKTIRDWDYAMNLWANNGAPAKDDTKPIPGPHPEPNHLWNTDKQAYCDKNGISFKFGADGDDDGVDDY